MFSKPGFATVTVTIIDSPSGPKGFILAVSDHAVRSQRSFAVSKLRFDKMWVAFISSGADKYARTQGAQGFDLASYDLASYYFFFAGKQDYMVPKKEASQALVSVATQLRAYAH